MATKQIENGNFYAATQEELTQITAEPYSQARLEAQNELASKVAPDIADNQGYTNAATFRAVMTGGPGLDGMPKHEREPFAFAQMFADLEGLRYTAGEPYAFSTGTGGLGYMGIVLASQHAEHNGESLVYSVEKIEGQSIENLHTGERFWGQVLLYNWRAGINNGHSGLDDKWAFNGVDEIAVVERSLDRFMPVLRADPSSYSELIGMPAIRRHYRDKDPHALGKLQLYFMQAQQKAAELGLVVPGNDYPLTNNR